METGTSTVLVNILVNSSSAAAGVNSFNQQMTGIVTGARNAATAAKNSFSELLGAEFFGNLAASGARAFGSALGDQLKESVLVAARTQELDIALGSLAKTSNLSRTALAENVKVLERANISMQTSRQVLLQYIAAGLPLEKAAPLANVAKDIAVIAGVSSQESFQRLIDGITTLQIRVLRTAGVYVTLKEAEAKYRQETGNTTTELTTQEKQMLLLNSVLAFGARAHGLYEAAMESTSKQMRSLERITQDFQVAFGDQLMPVLAAGVYVFSNVLQVLTKMPAAFLGITVALGVLAIALALSFTSFTTLTGAEVANALASSRLGVAYAQLGAVIAGTTAVTEVAAGSWILLTGAVLGVIGVLAGVAYAFYEYNKNVELTSKLTNDMVAAAVNHYAVVTDEAAFVKQLGTQVSATADQEKRLSVIYQELSPTAKARIDLISRETDALTALRLEKERQAGKDRFGLESEASTRAAVFAQELTKMKELEAQADKTREAFDNARAQARLDLGREQAGIEPRFRTPIDEETLAKRTADIQEQLQGSYANTTAEIAKQKEKVDDSATSLQRQAEIMTTSTDVLLGLNGATEHGGIANKILADTLSSVSVQHDKAADAAKHQTGVLQALIGEIEKFEALGKPADAQSARQSYLKDVQARAAATAAASDPSKAPQIYKDLLKQDSTLEFNGFIPSRTSGEDIQKQAQNFEKASKLITESDKSATKAHKEHRTEAESLTESLRKLNQQMQSLANPTNKNFGLRWEKEEKERIVRDMEQIITLRRELDMPLAGAIPTSAQGARQAKEQLERVKTLRDDVLSIYREIQDADDKLIVARLSASASVVDAQTRADTAYLTGLRERRNAEQQLTADIALELRKRADIAADTQRNIDTIEATAYKDFLAKETEKSNTLIKGIAELKAKSGSDFAGNEFISAGKAIADGAKPEINPVLGKLDKSNILLESILKAVSGSGLSGSSEFKAASDGKAIRPPNETDKQFRNFFQERGFNVVRTFGKAINEGSPHPYGGAADISVRNQAKDDIYNLMVDALQTGYRVFDERTVAKGVKQTGKHLHFENAKTTLLKPSRFVAEDFTSDQLSVLQQLDDARRGKGSGRLPSGASDGSDAKFGNIGMGGAGGFDPKFGGIIADNAASTASAQTKSVVEAVKTTFTKESFELFGNKSIEEYGQKAVDALNAYKDAEKEFNDTGTETRLGVEQTTLAMKVRFQVTAQLESAQREFNDLGKDSLRTTEVLREAEIARVKNLSALKVEIINLREEAKRGGRDPIAENLQVQKEYLTTINAVGKSEAALAQQRQLQGDAGYTLAKQQNDVLTEQTSLEKSLYDIENQRATAPLNEALRVRLATERELLSIQTDELKAGEDIAIAQVQIADSSVLHQNRVNAGVLQHIAGMQSVTQIYTSFKNAGVDAVWGGLDTVFSKLTGKLPIIGSALGQMLSNLAKIILNPLIMRVLGISGGATAGGSILSGGSNPTTSGGAGIGGILSAITGGGGAATTGGGISQFISAGTSSGGNFGLASSGLPSDLIKRLTGSFSPRDTLSAGGASALGGLTTAQQNILLSEGSGTGVIGQAGSQAAQGLFSGIGLKGIGTQLGQAAPLLGAGLGSMLGGQSGLGSILGGIGGGAAGLAVGIGTGVIGGTGTALAGTIAALGGTLAATGILAGIAVPLLIGAWALGRSKKRRQEEIQRTGFLTDAKSQLQNILKQTRSGRLDSATAMAQADAIRQNYIQQSNSLTDKKTRNIALQTVRELDSIITQIGVAGQQSDFAAAQENAYVPTFAVGGMASYVQSVASTSRNAYNDQYVARFDADTEAVLTRRDVAALGGVPAMRRAGVYGSQAMPSQVAPTGTAANVGSNGQAPNITVLVVADEEAADKIIGASSGKGMFVKMKAGVIADQDYGFAKTLESKLAGEL